MWLLNGIHFPKWRARTSWQDFRVARPPKKIWSPYHWIKESDGDVPHTGSISSAGFGVVQVWGPFSASLSSSYICTWFLGWIWNSFIIDKSEDFASLSVATFGMILPHVIKLFNDYWSLVASNFVISPHICCIVKCFFHMKHFTTKTSPVSVRLYRHLYRGRALDPSNCICIKRQKSDYFKIKIVVAFDLKRLIWWMRMFHSSSLSQMPEYWKLCGLWSSLVAHVPVCKIEFSVYTTIKTVSEWVWSVLHLRSSLATASWHWFSSPPLYLLNAQN